MGLSLEVNDRDTVLGDGARVGRSGSSVTRGYLERAREVICMDNYCAVLCRRVVPHPLLLRPV